MELRPYQVEARYAILRELEKVRSTLLVLATGLGKTVVFGSVARTYVDRGSRVLVLAHRGELLEQARGTLERFGLSVGLEQADNRVDREALPDVVLGSVQTLRAKRLETFAPDAFGLIVVDESHRAAAASYRAILDHFGVAKVLGVTATPDRTDGAGLKCVFDSCAYRMEVSEGICAGYLAPVSLEAVRVEGLDLSGVSKVAGDLHQGELEEVLTQHQVLLNIAGPLAERIGTRQTVCFAVGVKQAHDLAAMLRVRGVRAAAVDGTMSRADRAKALADYRGREVQVVVNAMLLTEGFDAPETSCIALVRPTYSRSLVAQQIGRGTRLAEGKDSCLVLDFVPERAPHIRLAAPADVLAGHDVDAEVAERIAEMSLSGDTRGFHALLEDATEQVERERKAKKAEREAAAAARADRERARRRSYLRKVGIVYASATMPTDVLLGEICPRVSPTEKRASPSQVEVLTKLGYEVDGELTRRQADMLFRAVKERRTRGLCTLKQSRFLAKHGLRPDLPQAEASRVIDAIKRNGWAPPAEIRAEYRAA